MRSAKSQLGPPDQRLPSFLKRRAHLACTASRCCSSLDRESTAVFVDVVANIGPGCELNEWVGTLRLASRPKQETALNETANLFLRLLRQTAHLYILRFTFSNHA